MAKPRSKVLDYLQYAALRIVSMALHAWPISMNLALASAAGEVFYIFDVRHRKRGMHNLRRCFPEKSERELRRLTRESMKQFFRLGVEVMFTTRLIKLDTFAQHIHFGDFKPALDLLLKNHSGLIMLTGHYGNWEVLGYTLATLGFETVSIARPLDNPYISNYVFGIREARGQKIVAKKGATPEVTAALERGGFVGLVADQNAGPKGLFVDFFGRKASTHKSIGILAMEYHVPVVIGYARRIGHNQFTFEVGTQDIIYPADWAQQDDPLIYITQRYTKAIEDFVRKDPGQYLWIHRRWKTRPKGEAPEEYD